LRDYVFFSLPSSRKWKALAYINQVITMLVGGLWHGVTWPFAIWGLLHGAALAIARRWQEWRGRRTPTRWGKFAAGLLTFHFVCFTWIFFRSESLANAGAILERIGSLTFSAENITAPIMLVMAIAVAGHYLPRQWYSRTVDLFARAPFAVQGAAMACLVLLIQYLAGRGSAGFIYSKF
jgi:D-alanyl-lipoteichoic acid acyltransferase DltB (MBOAT superfamily)